MLKTKDALSGYRFGCELLSITFKNRYFGKDTEIDYVCDDVTGLAIIGDYFISIDEMYEYMLHKYTKEQFFKRYHARLDNNSSENPQPFYNIKHWIKIDNLAKKHRFNKA